MKRVCLGIAIYASFRSGLSTAHHQASTIGCIMFPRLSCEGLLESIEILVYLYSMNCVISVLNESSLVKLFHAHRLKLLPLITAVSVTSR